MAVGFTVLGTLHQQANSGHFINLTIIPSHILWDWIVRSYFKKKYDRALLSNQCPHFTNEIEVQSV